MMAAQMLALQTTTEALSNASLRMYSRYYGSDVKLPDDSYTEGKKYTPTPTVGSLPRPSGRIRNIQYY